MEGKSKSCVYLLASVVLMECNEIQGFLKYKLDVRCLGFLRTAPQLRVISWPGCYLKLAGLTLDETK